MNDDGPLRIVVAGATGRMGTELLRLITGDPLRYRAAGAWVSPSSIATNRDIGHLIGIGETGLLCSATGEVTIPVDVVVDFSVAAAAADIARQACSLGAALVNGVTGLEETARFAFAESARQIPLLHAENFSRGVAVLAELVVLAKKHLGADFDIEIGETHHRAKRDTPSGTARMLGRALGDGIATVRRGPRRDGEIGYSVRRGGTVTGEHTVSFLGPHECLEFTHRAENRSLFAAGALRAAAWLIRQPPGLYTLRDSLVPRTN